MKRPSPGFIALSAAVTLALIPAAFGQTVYEPFGYINGALNGSNGGTGFSGPWNDLGDALIKSASPLAVSGLSGTGSYLDVTSTAGNGGTNRTLTSALNGDTWVSFLVRPDNTILSQGGLTIGDSFATVNGESGTDHGIYVGFNAAGAYGIGPVGGNLVITGGTAVPGTAQYLVADFDFTTASSGTVTLYVNATPTGTLGTAAGSEPFTLSTTNTIGFAVGGNGSSFDEIRIGNSFAAVTPIPEPATYAATAAFVALAWAAWSHSRRKVSGLL